MVRSARRVLDIFEAIAASPGGLGISDLARRLSIPKSSTSNLARTLLQRRYLEQLPGGRFVLGGRLFDVGVCARADTGLQAAARPVMAELVEKTGETVFLGILTPDYAVLELDKVVSPHVIRYDAELGEKRPAHCTAMGKVLLADLPEDQLGEYLATAKLERFTARTVVNRRALLAELRAVRRAGHSVSVEERVPGASAIGAPVRAPSRRAMAGIVVAGPTARIVSRRAELASLVKEAAYRIGWGLETAGGSSIGTPTRRHSWQATRRRHGRRQTHV